MASGSQDTTNIISLEGVVVCVTLSITFQIYCMGFAIGDEFGSNIILVPCNVWSQSEA